MKQVEDWLHSILITIIGVCAKGLFKYVALYCPNGDKGNVEGITMSNDEGYIDHMCTYEKPKEVFKP